MFLLLYVAIMIPLREGYGIPVETGSGTFWFEVFVDLYLCVCGPSCVRSARPL